METMPIVVDLVVEICVDEHIIVGEVGVRDTAFEVRRARADGIAVICVFTGDDEDLPAAKTVYGRDFARIRSVDQLADTVGMLIQNQIKNI